MLFKLNHEFYKQTNLAHQLSRNDERVSRTINKYHGCHIPRACWGNRTGSLRHCGNVLSLPLHIGFRVQPRPTSDDCSSEWRTASRGNRKSILPRIIFPDHTRPLARYSVQSFHPSHLTTSINFDRDIRGCHTISGLADLRSVFRFPDVGIPGILRGNHQNPCTYRFCHHPSEHERVAKLPIDFRCRKNSGSRNIGCSHSIHDLRTRRAIRVGDLHPFQNRQTALRPFSRFQPTTHGTTIPPVRLEHDALFYQRDPLVPFLYPHRTSRYHTTSDRQYHPEHLHDLFRHREFLLHHHGITRQ